MISMTIFIFIFEKYYVDVGSWRRRSLTELREFIVKRLKFHSAVNLNFSFIDFYENLSTLVNGYSNWIYRAQGNPSGMMDYRE